MSITTKPNSLSPNPPSNQSPASPKRLSYLLENVKSFEKNISRTRRQMKKSSSSNTRTFKKVAKGISKDPKKEDYLKNYNSHKVLSKTNSPPSPELIKKIETLLSPSKLIQKYPLTKNKFKNLYLIKKEYIDIEDLQKPETKDLLKSSRRNFGELFAKALSPQLSKPPLFPYTTKSSLRLNLKDYRSSYKEERNNLAIKLKIQKIMHKHIH